MVHFGFRGLRRAANISCWPCSLCSRDPLVRFGGHIRSSILHFLVDFLTLLVIVYGCDAYVVVDCDLLVHLAVDHVPVIRGTDSLRSLNRLNVL